MKSDHRTLKLLLFLLDCAGLRVGKHLLFCALFVFYFVWMLMTETFHLPDNVICVFTMLIMNIYNVVNLVKIWITDSYCRGKCCTGSFTVNWQLFTNKIPMTAFLC